ncbi:hypothetical protein [Paenibacillus bovis]|nr:hypothetical protein [Paenibacillus bovis]
MPIQESKKMADAVFTGEVTSIRPALSGEEPSTKQYTFAVQSAWKGKVYEQTSILASSESASCGITFEQGARYLIFARQSEGDLKTDRCSSNSPVVERGGSQVAIVPGTSEFGSSNGMNLHHLGESITILPGRSEMLGGHRMTAFFIGAGLLAAGYAIWWTRRRSLRQ